MYQLRLSVRPNNQVVLTSGWYRNAIKPVHLTASQSKPDSLKLRRALCAIERNRAPIGLRQDMKPYVRPTAKIWGKGRTIPPLDITEKSQRSQERLPRVGFGVLPRPKSFTNASGQKLKECGAAIDHVQPDKNKIYAVTLTMPSGTHESFEVMAAWSGYVINRLFQPIRRHYGDNCLWFFVWEYQKRGALHLHIAVSHETHAKKIAHGLIETWHKILADLTEKTGIEMWLHQKGDRCTLKSHWQNDAQPMKKGLGRYFSKYAGKKESKQAWYCKKYPVSRFWGCCYALKKIIKELSFEITIDSPQNSDFLDLYVADIIKALEAYKIASVNSYEFQVNIGSDSSPHVVADGERTTMYLYPDDYLKFLKFCRENLTKTVECAYNPYIDTF